MVGVVEVVEVLEKRVETIMVTIIAEVEMEEQGYYCGISTMVVVVEEVQITINSLVTASELAGLGEEGLLRIMQMVEMMVAQILVVEVELVSSAVSLVVQV